MHEVFSLNKHPSSAPICSTIRAFFPCSAQKLWNVVTNLSDTTWRSDLSHVIVSEDGQFIEYTRTGLATTFTTTHMEPPVQWTFMLENQNLSGEWTGRFETTANGSCLICTESVYLKRRLPHFIVFAYLKKQQKRYMRDLRRKLAS